MTAKRSPPDLAPAPGLRPPESRASLQIGEVAERTGVTQRTLRFYEEKGLLKPPSRLDGGFRLYSEEDVQRVERIRNLQSLLRLSLADIKEMVEAEEIKHQLRATYRRDAEISERRAKIDKAIELTQRQAGIIEQKRTALQDMKDQLEQKLALYRGWLAHLDEQEKAQT
jgi:DNA-binding transcriptional MerR regulator